MGSCGSQRTPRPRGRGPRRGEWGTPGPLRQVLLQEVLLELLQAGPARRHGDRSAWAIASCCGAAAAALPAPGLLLWLRSLLLRAHRPLRLVQAFNMLRKDGPPLVLLYLLQARPPFRHGKSQWLGRSASSGLLLRWLLLSARRPLPPWRRGKGLVEGLRVAVARRLVLGCVVGAWRKRCPGFPADLGTVRLVRGLSAQPFLYVCLEHRDSAREGAVHVSHDRDNDLQRRQHCLIHMCLDHMLDLHGG
mmetsp:Transcript_101322/g.295108  ORF Transcript_101322/g.295108 Transcript_101322/m.295108 type:complete len:248 (+) Transcript_101322:488-1231(+)